MRGERASPQLALFEAGYRLFLLALTVPASKPSDSDASLYDMAAVGGVTLAKAESARKLADLCKTKKDLTKAIDYYVLAADASAYAGKEQSRIEALVFEASLLFQQGEKKSHCKLMRNSYRW